MSAIEFDATRLYGYKILKDADNQPFSLQSVTDQAVAGVDAKTGQVKRHVPITAKIGDKIGDKGGIKGG